MATFNPITGPLQPNDFTDLSSIVRGQVASHACPDEEGHRLIEQIEAVRDGMVDELPDELAALVQSLSDRSPLEPEAHTRWMATLVAGPLRPTTMATPGAALFDDTRVRPDLSAPAYRTILEDGIHSVEQIPLALSLISALSPAFGAVIVAAAQRLGHIQITVDEKVQNSSASLTPRKYLDRDLITPTQVILKKGESLIGLLHELVHALPKSELPEPLRSSPGIVVPPDLRFGDMARQLQMAVGQEEAMAWAAEVLFYRDARRQGVDLKLSDFGTAPLLHRYAKFRGQNFSALADEILKSGSSYAHSARISGIITALSIRLGRLDAFLDPIDAMPSCITKTVQSDGKEEYHVDWKQAYQMVLQLADQLPVLKGKTSIEILQTVLSRAVTAFASGGFDNLEQMVFELIADEIERRIDGPRKQERGAPLAGKLVPAQALRDRPVPAEIKALDPARAAAPVTHDAAATLANYLHYLEYLRAENHTQGKSYFAAITDLAERSPDPLSSRLYAGLWRLAYEQSEADTPSCLLMLANSLVSSGYHAEALQVLDDYLAWVQDREPLSASTAVRILKQAQKMPDEFQASVAEKIAMAFDPFTEGNWHGLSGKFRCTNKSRYGFDDLTFTCAEKRAIAAYFRKHYPRIDVAEFTQFLADLLAERALPKETDTVQLKDQIRRGLIQFFLEGFSTSLRVTHFLHEESVRQTRRQWEEWALLASSYYWDNVGKPPVADWDAAVSAWRSENPTRTISDVEIRALLPHLPEIHIFELLKSSATFDAGLDEMRKLGAFPATVALYHIKWDEISKYLSIEQKQQYWTAWLESAQLVAGRCVEQPGWGVGDRLKKTRSELTHFFREQAETQAGTMARVGATKDSRTYLDTALDIVKICFESEDEELREEGRRIVAGLPVNTKRTTEIKPVSRNLEDARLFGDADLFRTTTPALHRAEALILQASADHARAPELLREAATLMLDCAHAEVDRDFHYHEARFSLCLKLIPLLMEQGLWNEASELQNHYRRDFRSQVALAMAAIRQNAHDGAAVNHWNFLYRREASFAVFDDVIRIHTWKKSGDDQRIADHLRLWSGQIETELLSGRSYYSAEATEQVAALLAALGGIDAEAVAFYQLAIDKYVMGYHGQADQSHEGTIWLDTFARRLIDKSCLGDAEKDEVLCYLIDAITPKSDVKLDGSLMSDAFSAAHNLYQYVRGHKRFPRTDEKLTRFLARASAGLIPLSQSGGRWDVLVVAQRSVAALLDDSSWLLDPRAADEIWHATQNWEARADLYRIHPEYFRDRIAAEIILPSGELNAPLLAAGLAGADEVASAIAQKLSACRAAAVMTEHEKPVVQMAARWLSGVLVEQEDLSRAGWDQLMSVEAWQLIFAPTAVAFRESTSGEFDETLVTELLHSTNAAEAKQKTAFYHYILSDPHFPLSWRRRAFDGLVQAGTLSSFIAGYRRGIRDGRNLHPIEEDTFYTLMARLLSVGEMQMPHDQLIFLMLDHPDRYDDFLLKYSQIQGALQRKHQNPIEIRADDPVDLALLYHYYHKEGRRDRGSYADDYNDFSRFFDMLSLSIAPDIDFEREVHTGRERDIVKLGFKLRLFSDSSQRRNKIDAFKQRLEAGEGWVATYASGVPELFYKLPRDIWAVGTNLLIAMPHNRREAVVRKFLKQAKLQGDQEALVSMLEIAGHAKLGQLFSIYLPPDWREPFARLQDEVLPSPQSAILTVFENEWRGRYGEIQLVDASEFSMIEQDGLVSMDPMRERQLSEAGLILLYPPVKSGTIGEVLKGRLADGRLVAIKVITPGRRETIQKMLQEMGAAGGALLKMGVSTLDGLSVADLVEQYIKTMAEECDFAKELEGASKMGALPDGIRSPTYHKDGCTSSVLVMDWVNGVKITDDQLTGAHHRRILDLLPGLVRKVFADLVLQADPHPGNILYCAETDDVVLLDFGQTIHMDLDIMDALCPFLIAYGTQDATAMAEAMGRMAQPLSWRSGKRQLEPDELQDLASVITAERQGLANHTLSGESDHIIGLFRLLKKYDRVVDKRCYQLVKALGMLEKSMTRLRSATGYGDDFATIVLVSIQAYYLQYYTITESGEFIRKDILAKRQAEEAKSREVKWPWYVKFLSLEQDEKERASEQRMTPDVTIPELTRIDLSGLVPGSITSSMIPLLPADPEGTALVDYRASEIQALQEAYDDPSCHLILVTRPETMFEVTGGHGAFERDFLRRQVLEKGVTLCTCNLGYTHHAIPGDFADTLLRLPTDCVQITVRMERLKPSDTFYTDLQNAVQQVALARPGLKVMVVATSVDVQPETAETLTADQVRFNQNLQEHVPGGLRWIPIHHKLMNFLQLREALLTWGLQILGERQSIMTLEEADTLIELLYRNFPPLPYLINFFRLVPHFDEDAKSNFVRFLDARRAKRPALDGDFNATENEQSGQVQVNLGKQALLCFPNTFFKLPPDAAGFH